MNIGILFTLLSYSFLRCSESAKILGMFPLAGRSLNILTNKLMVALANAGHEVTLISAHKPKEQVQNGSLKYIHLTGFWEDYDAIMEKFDPWNVQEKSNILGYKSLLDLTKDTWNQAFKIPEFRRLLNSNERFDAVILEDTWSDCFRILSQIFNCPLILFSSISGNHPHINSAIGNILPPSYVPHFSMVGPHFNGMNFSQRVYNFVVCVVDSLVQKFYMFPIYNEILQSNFKNPPDVATFYNNISLVLLGSHSSLRQPAPLLPNVIEIGGFHIDPPKKLPKDLQNFLDGATDGAIYFSLGSHVNSKDMPEKVKNMFLKIFGKLKQRVLWKFEEELLGKPENVLIKKWMPQTDILAHPNIRLFITHAGHGSALEAIYHGIPCLMIPLFFDQFNLAYQAVQKGFAIKISYRDENELTLTKAVEELLNNPKYQNSAKKMQRLFHDRPMKPLDTAIYWIEYVIRHKGADHLKVAGLNMPWYQFYSIDVIVFLLSILLLLFYVSYLVLSNIFCKKKNAQKRKVH